MATIQNESVIAFNRDNIDWFDARDKHSARVYNIITRNAHGWNVMIQRTADGRLLYSDRLAFFDITGAKLDRKDNKRRPFQALTETTGPGQWRSAFTVDGILQAVGPATEDWPDMSEKWAEWGGAPDGTPLTVTTMMQEASYCDTCFLRVADGENAGQFVLVNRNYLRLVTPSLYDFEQHVRVDLTPDCIVRVRTKQGALMALIAPMIRQEVDPHCPLCERPLATPFFDVSPLERLTAQKREYAHG